MSFITCEVSLRNGHLLNLLHVSAPNRRCMMYRQIWLGLNAVGQEDQFQGISSDPTRSSVGLGPWAVAQWAHDEQISLCPWTAVIRNNVTAPPNGGHDI